jgi:hypothetical protein
MLYLLWAVVIAIAVVLLVFTGMWGGRVWILVAGIALAFVFAARARSTTVERPATEPTGQPRGTTGSAGTANERVGASTALRRGRRRSLPSGF